MRYQRKLQTLFVPLCLFIILCIGFSIAKDYSKMSAGDLLDALSDTNIAMALFNEEDELSVARNRRNQLEADLRFQTPHYVLAAAVKLALEEKIAPWQSLYDIASGLYNEAMSDLYVAEINIGIADIRMQEALREGNSENYRYWSGIYSFWQQQSSEAHADKFDAQSRADTAYSDMIRIWVVLEPLKHKLQVHNTFTYYPLEAERNRLLTELSIVNSIITTLEIYYRNLELTAQALQNEINKRNQASGN